MDKNENTDNVKKALNKLQELKIPYEICSHPPVYTIEECYSLKLEKKGEILKNLFLCDDKGRDFFLVVIPGSKKAELSKLSEALGYKKMRFASENRLMQYLGLEKGHVTPLGVVNDTENFVSVIFDASLKDGKMIVGVHPNSNEATVFLEFADLLKYVGNCGSSIDYVGM